MENEQTTIGVEEVTPPETPDEEPTEDEPETEKEEIPEAL